MYIQPNRERLKKLDLSDVAFGENIMFCENCDFQINGQVGMKSECPECGTKPLYIIKLDKDLLKLRTNYLFELLQKTKEFHEIFIDNEILLPDYVSKRSI